MSWGGDREAPAQDWGDRSVGGGRDRDRDGGGMGGGGGGGGGGGRGGYDDREPTPLPESAPFEAFVGSLDYSTTEDDLVEVFARVGRVIKARVVMDRETGQSKGFAIIEFDALDGLKNALTLNNEMVRGRAMRVDVAGQRNRGGAGGGGGGGGFGGGRGDDNPNSYGQRGFRAVQADSFDYEKEPDAESLKRRPKLKLLKRGETAPKSAAAPAAAAAPKAAGKKKSNPFGAARPREEILAERRHVTPEDIMREEAEKEVPRSVGAVNDAALAASEAESKKDGAGSLRPGATDAKGAADDGFAPAARGRGRRERRASDREAKPVQAKGDGDKVEVVAKNPYDALEDN